MITNVSVSLPIQELIKVVAINGFV